MKAYKTMKTILLIILAIFSIQLMAQSDDVYDGKGEKNEEKEISKNEKSIVIKENKFYEYQIQKDIASKDFIKSGRFLITSQVIGVIGSSILLINMRTVSEQPNKVVTILGSIMIGATIPLTVASGVKMKQAGQELKKASFYDFTD